MNMGGVFSPAHIHFPKVQANSLQKVFFAQHARLKIERSEDGRRGE
jgi:hypothetical protein